MTTGFTKAEQKLNNGLADMEKRHAKKQQLLKTIILILQENDRWQNKACLIIKGTLGPWVLFSKCPL